MEALPHLRVVLQVDPVSEPIQGWVHTGCGQDAEARAFSGWLELSTLIEDLRAGAISAGDREPVRVELDRGTGD